ncbi:SIMPL domain-containing protein [Desulfobacula sp.]|uniref:SIMPL domain-containing protein n=1 Tax=Desulfobacula sp. TaxID=2593537 RepID=UPI00262B9D2B|nr:SIMPL domain-containing protein [Desulfobacula sp.]
MRKIFIMTLLAGVFLNTLVVSAKSVPAEERNLILTDGTAEVTGKNDSVRISIGVVTEGRSLEMVSAANMDITGKVLLAVKSLNIEHLALKTTDYRVIPQRDYKAKPPKIKGYEVHNGVAVILEGFAPDQLSMHTSIVIAKALENGANNIHSIKFYIKDRTLLENEALARATRQAVIRAETLAKAAGVKLKRIVSLSTYPVHKPPMPTMFRSAGIQAKTEAMAPPMESGESRIRVQVSLAYEIE